MTSLFISHANTDRRFVKDEFVDLFRALGFKPWYAEKDITSPNDWERMILKGLNEAKWFVFVMSKAAASSQWVKAEVNWAVPRRHGNIIPILIDDVPLDQFNITLANIQYIDYRGNRRKVGRNQLINLLVDVEYRPQSHFTILEGLTRCPSKEVLTLVRAVSRSDLLQSTIIAANERANRFYGRMAGKSVVGLTLHEILTTILPQWVDSEDLSRFVADQERIMAGIKRCEEIYAKVPIRINGNHPISEVRGNAYLPITLAYSQSGMDQGPGIEDYLIIYVRLEDLCRVHD